MRFEIAPLAVAVTSAPEITWLDTERQVAGEEFVDRAAKYDTPTNLPQWALHRKVARLDEQYAPQMDWDNVYNLVTDRVRAAGLAATAAFKAARDI